MPVDHNEIKQTLKAFNNALPFSAPQDSADLDKTYVDRNVERAYDPRRKLSQLIANEPDEENGYYLFSGLRGSGKTMELKRLIEDLEKTPGVLAFYCDASEYLDIRNPDLGAEAIITTAISGLCDAVREKYGPATIDLDVFLNDLSEKIQSLEDNSLKATLSKAVGQMRGMSFFKKIKAGPVEVDLNEKINFHKELASLGQKHKAAFFNCAARYTQTIVDFVKNKADFPVKKMVLVVDSLERLTSPIQQETVLYNSLKNIFETDPRLLRLSGVSIVYTVPPYLDALLPAAYSSFSGYACLSNFKVINSFGDPTPNPAGIELMVEIVEKRFPDWEKVLSRKVIECFAFNSGGNVRLFFQLLSEFLTVLALYLTEGIRWPMDDPKHKTVGFTHEGFIRHWRFLSETDRRWLGIFQTERDPWRKRKNDEDTSAIIRLFTGSLVLNYQNGENWYRLSPLLSKYLSDSAKT